MAAFQFCFWRPLPVNGGFLGNHTFIIVDHRKLYWCSLCSSLVGPLKYHSSSVSFRHERKLRSYGCSPDCHVGFDLQSNVSSLSVVQKEIQ